ncbi:hypothetical protein B5U27_10980 [Pseudomonas amygdali pv. lachrymans]|nr:hypothetical protein B5U27_10980 [Pseudomonas amygdali pv. lachrymans]
MKRRACSRCGFLPYQRLLHLKALFYHDGTDDAECDVSDG